MSFSERAPPPTEVIKSILNAYPFSVGLFRELLQNSDDAQATQQVFVLDWRSHPTNSLAHPGLAGSQGPALLAYNNALFKDVDWTSLQALHQSCKRTDTSKIGKYGMGFRSCYHVTDRPQILSGDNLGILDPDKSVFLDGGHKYHLAEYSSRTDQLTAFEAFIEREAHNRPFEGTIIRLPLRNTRSQISDKVVTPEEIHDLLLNFIRSDLEAVMLFLSHLNSIEIHEITDNGRRCLATAKLEKQIRQSDLSIGAMRPDASLTANTYICEVRIESNQTEHPSTTWRILHAAYTPPTSQNLLSDRLAYDASSTLLESTLRDNKLLPHVSLAFPLHSRASLRGAGRLYTFLPLPVYTGFPVHVHALFALDAARSHLRSEDDGVNHHSSDKILVEWNRVLFDTFIPSAWAHLLPVLIGDNLGDIFQAWPQSQTLAVTGDARLWERLPVLLLEEVGRRQSAVWPTLGGTRRHLSFNDVAIAADTEDEATLNALTAAGLVITRIPTYIVDLLRHSQLFHMMLTPLNAHDLLCNNADPFHSLTSNEMDLITIYLLSTNDISNLANLPLVFLVDEERAPGERVSLTRAATSPRVHPLMSSDDADLFAPCDPSAVALYRLPEHAQSLLRETGPVILNVTSLHPSRLRVYLIATLKRYNVDITIPSEARATERFVDWLALFWEWLARQTTRKELYGCIQDLPLLPTTMDALEAPRTHVLSSDSRYPASLHASLALLGVPIVSIRISDAPRRYLNERNCIKEASDIRFILDRARTDLEIGLDPAHVSALRNHLVSYLPQCVRNEPLTATHKRTMKSLSIFPLLSPPLSSTDGAYAATPCVGKIPEDRHVIGVTNMKILPAVDGVVYLDCSLVNASILSFIDGAQHFSSAQILALAVTHFTRQPMHLQCAILKYMATHRDELTSGLLGSLENMEFVVVGDGTSLRAPMNVIDPHSSISELFLDLADLRLPNCSNSGDASIVTSLQTLGLLKRALSDELVLERIAYLARTQDRIVAKCLLNLLNKPGYDCSGLRLDLDLPWLPVIGGGLLSPRQCRDRLGRYGPELFNEVMSISEVNVESITLRRVLGWDKDLPIEVIQAQLVAVAAKSDFLRLIDVIKHLAERTITNKETETLADALLDMPWIPIDPGCILPSRRVLVPPKHETARTSVPRGFAVASGFLDGERVRNFLVRIGCPERFSNSELLQEMECLATDPAATPLVTRVVDLLKNFDHGALTDIERLRILVPDQQGQLHPLSNVYFNDLGERIHAYDIPNNTIIANSVIGRDLAMTLGMQTVISLDLQEIEEDEEDMGEKLTDRISTLLLQYTIEQAFNEFLANAADAGATSFEILLDEYRTVGSENLLSLEMKELQLCPALVIHNNSTFTNKDFKGILRVGTGGKRDRMDTIGQFGLGSLVMFHFTEMAMIVSRDQVLFLDPSRTHLAAFTKRATSPEWLVCALNNEASRYSDHLEPLYGLYGFNSETRDYPGTLFRLPLRNFSQAKRSLLWKISSSTAKVRELMNNYQDAALESLLFTKVNSITARHRIPHRMSLTQVWSVSVTRDNPRRDGDFDIRILHLYKALGLVEDWFVATMAVELAPDFNELKRKHRVRSSVAVGLSGRLSKSTSPSMRCKLFSTLPLPIAISLPLHCNAPFVLAPDRRNIRFDGDGTSNPESRYNRWLIAALLPKLYLFVLEALFNKPNIPWPGDASELGDHISRTLVDAFYNDHLAQSSRLICPRNPKLEALGPMQPPDAVLSGAEPSVIKKLLMLLERQELTSLPCKVRERALQGGMKGVDPAYIRRLIEEGSTQFCDGFHNDQIRAGEIQMIAKYLVDSPVGIMGLPLIPLADRTLGVVQGSDGKTQFYTWKPNRKGVDLFPSDRLVHRDFDAAVLGQGLNVRGLSPNAVISFLRDRMPEISRHRIETDAYDAHSRWINHFWDEFDTLKIPPDSISSFPLVQTYDREFISLDMCKTTSVLVAEERSWRLVPVSQLGATVIPRYLCPTALGRILDKFSPFTFEHFLRFIDTIRYSLPVTIFRLPSNRRFVEWLRTEVSQLAPYIADLYAASRALPIWVGLKAQEDELLIAANDAIMLPAEVKCAVALPFLNVRFVEFSPTIKRLGVQPLTIPKFRDLLQIPLTLALRDHFDYKRLLQCLITNRLYDSRPVLVPSGDLVLVEPGQLYDRRVPLFRAALQTRPRMFVHVNFSELEDQLSFYGLKRRPDVETWRECATVIDQDITGHHREERADTVYQYYCDELRLNTPQIGHRTSYTWDQFDSLRFIPRDPAPFRSIQSQSTLHVSTLPSVVAPVDVVRPGLEPIVWTRRASCFSPPSRRLLLDNMKFGLPTVPEVVEHLRTLANDFARNHPHNNDILADLRETYSWLNQICQASPHEVKNCISSYSSEAIFLNVDDPKRQEWTWHSADHMLFDFDDSGGQFGVRQFLEQYKDLLLAAGVLEFTLPSCPDIAGSSYEDSLLALRTAFNKMRREECLVDITFEGSDAENGASEPLKAHRVYLATQSGYFLDMFSSGFQEMTSTSEPVRLEYSNRCLRYTLEYMYTGSAPVPDDDEEIWEILQLSNYWRLTHLHHQQQVNLRRFIPLSSEERDIFRSCAEQYNAQALVQACIDFEKDNAMPIRRLDASKYSSNA